MERGRMKRARLVEVDWHQFQDALKRAAVSGQRIEKTDKTRWAAYIKENEVQEASCMSIARAKAETVKSVIIEGGDWDGFFVYSSDDELCLRLVPWEV